MDMQKILSTVVTAYLEAATFTDTGEEDQPAAGLDFSTRGQLQAWETCADFLRLCEEEGLLSQYRTTGRTWDSFGHDYWLTRNGHGAGFWDRGMGALGEALSNFAAAQGTRYVFETDTGELEFD